MKLAALKKIRVAVSLLFFIVIAVLFLDISHNLPPSVFNSALYLQFAPSLIKFITVPASLAFGFIIILALTALFGRVYCSTICPLGALQDIIARAAGVFRKKRKKYKFTKPHNLLRYGLLIITIVSLVFGTMLLINLLGPYTIFGKVASDLARPAYIWANNLLAALFESFGSYYFYFTDVKGPALEALIIPSIALIALAWMAFKSGRLWCNTVCPVGALLGFLSKYSIYSIGIDRKSCTSCGKCETVCKAGCIDTQNSNLDFSRCVSCFNCFEACPEGGFRYLPKYWQEKDKNELKVINIKPDMLKREMLFGGAALLTASAGFGRGARRGTRLRHRGKGKAVVPVYRHRFSTPPGSLGQGHYVDSCIACHLCVSACPTFVLQPAFLEYGLQGLLQPKMDYDTSYCNYECTACGDICPTGAILPVTIREKNKIQIGLAKFVKDNCIVYTKNKDCGACAEHCPTKAVSMQPDGDLTAPVVEEGLCVGCGACEYICPTRPYKAIYVEGHYAHKEAEIRKQEKVEGKTDFEEDFPF